MALIVNLQQPALLYVLVLASTGYACMAQNTPQDYIDAHSSPRVAVGVAAMTWNTTVAAYAQNYANQMASTCNLVHSNGPYGENIAWSSSSTFTGTAAVNMWANEKQYYTYSTNSCAAGKVCGHYTQVVWRNSVRLGCGRVVCNNNMGTFIICSYDPPGNYAGQSPY